MLLSVNPFLGYYEELKPNMRIQLCFNNIGGKYDNEIEQDRYAVDARSACFFGKHMVRISSVYIGFGCNMLFPIK